MGTELNEFFPVSTPDKKENIHIYLFMYNINIYTLLFPQKLAAEKLSRSRIRFTDRFSPIPEEAGTRPALQDSDCHQIGGDVGDHDLV